MFSYFFLPPLVLLPDFFQYLLVRPPVILVEARGQGAESEVIEAGGSGVDEDVKMGPHLGREGHGLGFGGGGATLEVPTVYSC